MIVDRELEIAVADDIPVYACAHALRRAVHRHVPARTGADILLAADTVAVLVSEALCAEGDQHQLTRLRQAELVLDLLRAEAWTLHRGGSLDGHAFDAVVLTAARCRREVMDNVVRARHRAWARLHGAACAKASSRREIREKNSSSSKSR